MFDCICDHLFITVVVIFSFIAIFNNFLKNHVNKYKQSKFTAFIARFCTIYNKATVGVKTNLFAPLLEMKSHDPDLKQQGRLRILEVGCGSGANLEFLPKESQLVMLDLNAAFEPLLRENMRAHPSLQLERFLEADVQDMSAVADGSVDAVVCTLVLCSVSDEPRALAEMRRVLAPGGKLFFLEHVGAKKGTVLEKIQWILTQSGLWPYFFSGCKLTKDIAQMVQRAGFSSVTVDNIQVFSEEHVVFKLIKYQIVGVATK